MSLNQFNAIGRLTREPETRAAGGSSVTGLSLAINRSYKDKRTEKWVDVTTFIRCNAWGRESDIAATLSKGDSVVISGSLETSAWTDKDGNKRENIECRVQTISGLVDAPKRGQGNGGGDGQSFEQAASLNDEIPF